MAFADEREQYISSITATTLTWKSNPPAHFQQEWANCLSLPCQGFAAAGQHLSTIVPSRPIPLRVPSISRPIPHASRVPVRGVPRNNLAYQELQSSRDPTRTATTSGLRSTRGSW